jgi:O-antigen ligase
MPPTAERGSSTASIVYGALALFFIIRKRWLFAAASFVFALFTFKRTSYVYLAGALALWGVAETCILAFGERNRKRIVMTVGLGLFAASLLCSFYIIDGLTFIQTNYFPDVPLHELTTGRSPLYRVIEELYGSYNFGELLFGRGPGFVEIQALDSVNIDLAHNEYLHHFMDYGILGLVFFACFTLGLVRLRPRYYPVAYYFMLVSLTDNPFYVFIICVPIVFLFSMEIAGASAGHETRARGPTHGYSGK